LRFAIFVFGRRVFGGLKASGYLPATSNSN